MEFQFNPLNIILRVFNDLYPNVHGEIIFVDELYDNEGVWSGIQQTEEVPARILIDSYAPITGVVIELCDQFSVLICDEEERDYEEELEAISNYLYERYKQYVYAFTEDPDKSKMH